jgi:hypothetical protein
VVVYRCGAPDFGVRHPNCEKYPSPFILQIIYRHKHTQGTH